MEHGHGGLDADEPVADGEPVGPGDLGLQGARLGEAAAVPELRDAHARARREVGEAGDCAVRADGEALQQESALPPATKKSSRPPRALAASAATRASLPVLPHVSLTPTTRGWAAMRSSASLSRSTPCAAPG